MNYILGGGTARVDEASKVDIVMSSKNNKITAFPKETMNDIVYGAQNRLFNYLRQKGIVVAESIQGGSYYGAIEGLLESP